MSGVLVAVPALPLLAAVVIRLASLTPRTAARLVVGTSAAAAFGALALLISVGLDGPVDAVITSSDGAAIVGLMADRVGAILLLLTSLVGLIVQSFASRSLLGDPRATRFHVLAAVLASAASLVGVAATGSGLLVAWVATSVALVALLGHKAPWPAAVRSQRLTARSFLVGDLALLLAMIVAIVTVGDLDLRAVGAEAAALDAESVGSLSVLTIVAIGLVIAGVARSALVPLHSWLPSTLSAPTPVSALLHAGVVNGAGVLLIRFSPVFASSVERHGPRLRRRHRHSAVRDGDHARSHGRQGRAGLVDLRSDGLHGGAARRRRVRRGVVPHRRPRALQGGNVPGRRRCHLGAQPPEPAASPRSSRCCCAHCPGNSSRRRPARAVGLVRTCALDHRPAPHRCGSHADRALRSALRREGGKRMDVRNPLRGHPHDRHRDSRHRGGHRRLHRWHRSVRGLHRRRRPLRRTSCGRSDLGGSRAGRDRYRHRRRRLHAW